MNSIRIISDGTAFGTRVFNHEGREVRGVTAIRIHEIKPGGYIRTSLDFINVGLELQADWHNHPLKQWAVRRTS